MFIFTKKFIIYITRQKTNKTQEICFQICKEVKEFHMNGVGIGLSPKIIRLLIDDLGLIKRIKLTGQIFVKITLA